MFKRISIILALFAVALAGIFASVALADKPPQPGASHEKVTLCHATGSSKNPFVEITVNFNSVEDAQHIGGHGGHSGDIIPPFTYTDSHGSFSFGGQGDQSILANGCKVTQTTTEQTTTQETTTQVTTTVPTTTSTPSTTQVTTTVPTTTSTPGTTTGSTTTGTTTIPAVVPPTNGGNSPGATQAPGVTKKSLQAKLKKQAAQPGTGRTSNASAPGELSNTGLPVWIVALFGALMLGSGMVIRKRI